MPTILSNDLTIQENMEMLEAALKHSLDWSISNRPSVQRQANTANAKLDCELAHDSHVRAFLTRFKIELNHLMGAKWMRANNKFASGSSLFDDTSTTCCTDEEEDEVSAFSTSHHGPAAPAQDKPLIKMKGKYAGVYQIGCDDDEEEDFDSELSAAMAKCTLSLARTGDQQQLLLEDDGYRSLSRGSGSLQRQQQQVKGESVGGQCIIARAKVSLLQQLNDIRSRIIDLVDEIDQCTNQARLPEDELEAYRRRRDALILRLDTLIDQQRVCSNQVNEGANRLSCTPNQSAALDDGYEEQVQIIDYDFSRRASDLSLINKSRGRNRMSDPLVSQASMTKVDVCNQAPVTQAVQGAKIDFGAMMRDYESRKEVACKAEQQVTANNHMASSSATSSYSNSTSTASSSSFI